MMHTPSNSIQKRVSDFLEKYPPFSFMSEQQLSDLSSSIEVKYFAKGEQIFHSGEPGAPYAYVVREGSVELHADEDDTEKLVDVCDEGDIFGMASLISGKPYIMTARAAEDTMIYAIPGEIFKPVIESNPRISLFFVAGFASGLPYAHDYEKRDSASKTLNAENEGLSALEEEDSLVIDTSNRRIVDCSADTTIQQAAIIMSEENVGSILITDENKHPKGIITDTDFRKKVVTGKYSTDQKVSEIMSSPVATIPADFSVARIILLMMNRNIRHLCITRDGTEKSEAISIVSEHDVLVLHGNNPAVLVKEFLNARKPESLRPLRDRAEELMKQYLRQEISITFIADIITEINDALIHSAIRLSMQAMEQEEGKTAPDVAFAWLSLGSEGRKEQLLRTDQDNALIYEDVSDQNDAAVKTYFLELAERVTGILEQTGFERCPSFIMASNEEWCNSLSRWQEIFGAWIRTPEPKSLMHSTIFFDFRTVYGDDSLTSKLEEFIYNQIKKEGLFLPYLARNAMQNPPPLSFFRNFIVERSGEHKNEFDIKLRGMMPLADAARVMAFEQGLANARGTFERFQKIAEQDKDHADLAKDAANAYGLMMRLRAKNGLRRGDSGRYMDPEQLNKIERQTLRNAFQTIADIQTVLKVHFQLDYLH